MLLRNEKSIISKTTILKQHRRAFNIKTRTQLLLVNTEVVH